MSWRIFRSAGPGVKKTSPLLKAETWIGGCSGSSASVFFRRRSQGSRYLLMVSSPGLARGVPLWLALEACAQEMVAAGRGAVATDGGPSDRERDQLQVHIDQRGARLAFEAGASFDALALI